MVSHSAEGALAPSAVSRLGAESRIGASSRSAPGCSSLRIRQARIIATPGAPCQDEDYPGDMVLADGKTTFREKFGPRGVIHWLPTFLHVAGVSDIRERGRFPAHPVGAPRGARWYAAALCRLRPIAASGPPECVGSRRGAAGG